MHVGRKSSEKAGRREGAGRTEQADVPVAGKAWEQKARAESLLENQKKRMEERKFADNLARIKFLRQARLRMSGHAFTVVDYRALLIFIPHIMADNAVSQ